MRRLLDDLERHLAEGLRADARRAGLDEAAARILLAVEPGEAVPMGDLSLRISRDPSTTTRFVDRAVKAGLVTRAPGLDRRRRLLELTPDGDLLRERLVRLRQSRAEALPPAVQAKTGLGEGEVEWFLDALMRALLQRGGSESPREISS